MFSYISVSARFITSQDYTYDNLYQLIAVHGNTEYRNSGATANPTFTSVYNQTYSFDILGNMETKYSREKTTYNVRERIGDNLNYSFNYKIEEGFVHRYSQIGSRYYRYDEVGNITVEQEGAFGEEGDGDYYKIDKHDEDVYGVNEAWGYYIDSGKEDTRFKNEKYHREFTWDEKNQLIKSVDNTVEVSFVYGEDGKRTNKYTSTSETLYFNSFWTYNNDGSTSFKGGAVSKHIFLGETRLLTAINDYDDAVRGAYGTEKDHIYYYHSDHLGSAQLVTNSEGEEYQRIEYTPYGETWVDVKVQGNKELVPLSYRFSAKELDKETGFYYYGARYLDPKYSRWISADPAMNTGEYFPVAPVDDEAKKHNGNLPGMGGIFNHINGNLYHYAANNPVKYTDPDGRDVWTYKSEYDNLYIFKADFNTFESASRSALGFIPFPFAGDAVLYVLDKATGFKKINQNTGAARLMEISGTVTNTIQSIEILGKVAGYSSKYLSKLSKIAGSIGTVLTAIDVISKFSKAEEVSIDLLVSSLFGEELQSTSHENVEALYVYAKSKTVELIKEGNATYYNPTKDGYFTDYSYKPEKVEQVKEELKILRQFLEEN